MGAAPTRPENSIPQYLPLYTREMSYLYSGVDLREHPEAYRIGSRSSTGAETGEGVRTYTWL